MTFTDIINEASCDKRIKNGILDIKNEEHILILEEYLIKYGYPMEEVVNKMSKYIKEGNFPERQAYNKDGILVTFPSPEYKQRAIRKGTHFERNPKAGGDGTLYGGTPTGPNQPDQYQNVNVFNGPEDAYQNIPANEFSGPLEVDLTDSGEGIEMGDLRSEKDKKQDAEAVKGMLGVIEPTITEQKI